MENRARGCLPGGPALVIPSRVAGAQLLDATYCLLAKAGTGTSRNHDPRISHVRVREEPLG
jgi:hypothetical protein